jgi:hypothetical protein
MIFINSHISLLKNGKKVKRNTAYIRMHRSGTAPGPAGLHRQTKIHFSNSHVAHPWEPVPRSNCRGTCPLIGGFRRVQTHLSAAKSLCCYCRGTPRPSPSQLPAHAANCHLIVTAPTVPSLLLPLPRLALPASTYTCGGFNAPTERDKRHSICHMHGSVAARHATVV